MADVPPALPRREAIELALKTFGGNPAELQILLACAREQTTAVAVSKAIGVRLGSVAYHFRELRGDGLIRQTRVEAVRGTIAKYHTATPKGRKLLAQLGLAPDGDQIASS